jgi:hypothetical protein
LLFGTHYVVSAIFLSFQTFVSNYRGSFSVLQSNPFIAFYDQHIFNVFPFDTRTFVAGPSAKSPDFEVAIFILYTDFASITAILERLLFGSARLGVACLLRVEDVGGLVGRGEVRWLVDFAVEDHLE